MRRNALLFVALAAVRGEHQCGSQYTNVTWGSDWSESTCVGLFAPKARHMYSGAGFDNCETEICQAAGGYLAYIESREEFDAIYSGLGLVENVAGAWPQGCAFVGLERCSSGDWEWTTASDAEGGNSELWADGEPNDWAGSEDCAMICPEHIGEFLNDGPCHNPIQCICEEAGEGVTSSYKSGACPDTNWGAMIFVSFLLSFVWCFSAGFCCTGLKQVQDKKTKDYLTIIIIILLMITAGLWHGVINPIWGINPNIVLVGLIGWSGGACACVFANYLEQLGRGDGDGDGGGGGGGDDVAQVAHIGPVIAEATAPNVPGGGVFEMRTSAGAGPLVHAEATALTVHGGEGTGPLVEATALTVGVGEGAAEWNKEKSLTEKLRELQRARNEGLISEEEHAKSRAALLGL